MLATENSPLGKKIKSIIEAGHLVPNEVVMEIAENFLKKKTKAAGAIFDGIPRNKEQNETFEALLEKNKREYTGIYFKLSRDEAETRLLRRRACVNCKNVYPAIYPKEKGCERCGGILAVRADDNPQSVRTRLDIFYKETLPVIEDWKTRGKILEIDASPTIEKITAQLLKNL
mgnify:CR=1 FL=1